MKLKIHPEAKALIFDLDGTLSDSLPVHIASWHSVCNELNCVFDERIVLEMTGMATISFAERIKLEQNLSIPAEELVKLKHQKFWQMIHLIKPYHEVINLAKSAFGLFPMAVGTGASRTSAEMQLNELKIANLFNVVVTADDVVRHKPSPETFLQCAELLNIAPQFCQVFEDGELGFQAVNRSGMILTDVRPFVHNT
jgi:beta-phosphoglucomutase-like phosphatase (HAD superfamily)